MPRTLNHVQLIGRLGRDPEMRYLNSGKAVVSFTLATNHATKNAAGGWDETTEWTPCTAWDKLAETANQYLSKGSQVYVAGRLQTRTWEKDGQKHSRTEVVVNELILLDSKRDVAPVAAERVDHLDDDTDVPF